MQVMEHVEELLRKQNLSVAKRDLHEGRHHGAKLRQAVTNPIRKEVKPLWVSSKHHMRPVSFRG